VALIPSLPTAARPARQPRDPKAQGIRVLRKVVQAVLSVEAAVLAAVKRRETEAAQIVTRTVGGIKVMVTTETPMATALGRREEKALPV